MTLKQSEVMKASWAKRKADGTVRKYKKRVKVKGAWSKKAKEQQSIRLKAYWKAKLQNTSPTVTYLRSETSGDNGDGNVSQTWSHDSLTITQRLDLIVSQISRIREQIGGANGV